jgi:hypothetical protein
VDLVGIESGVSETDTLIGDHAGSHAAGLDGIRDDRTSWA